MNVPCWLSRLGVEEASNVMVSPMETVAICWSVTVGVSGGASSNRTVILSASVPFPPPSGLSVLSTTRSNSSPSSVEGICHVKD